MDTHSQSQAAKAKQAALAVGGKAAAIARQAAKAAAR